MNITHKSVSHSTGTSLPVNCLTEPKSSKYLQRLQDYTKKLIIRKFLKEKK